MSEHTRYDELVPLSCTASWPRPDVCVVHLAGEIDIATTPVVAGFLRDHTAGRPAELVLDLSAVTLLGAAGVALIVRVLRNDGDVHGRLHLTGVTGNRPVERVLNITGLRPVLDVGEDVQTLLHAFPRR